jgi:hypothetical protein
MASLLNDKQVKWLKKASPFREPIAPSLSPKALQWESASNSLLAILVDVFGIQGIYLVASGASATEISYCRVTDVDRDADLFIKIVPKRLASGLQRSGSISDYVKDCGLSTPACRPGFPRVCVDGRMIFAYPFVDGVYLNNSIGDLEMLGGALAKLHTTLISFPETHKIARSQRGMRTRMRRKARELLADTYWASGELASVRAQIMHWLEIDTLIGKNECQVIHNDLNAGNVLKDIIGNIWFLDFEEARWSYLPPYFDIAKVIERFILVNESWDVQAKIFATRRFLDAYGIDRREINRMGGKIPIALRWLLGFSWLRMSNLLFDREAIKHFEVRKFLRLTKLLDENESWLAAL